MKVLLIATNQTDRFMDRMVVRPVPIGLAYLAAVVDEGKHQLKVLDLMFSDDAVADVEGAVKSFQPDLVGLSIRNLDNQSYLNPVWNLPAVRDIVRKIKSLGDAKTLCGGPAFSILPSECLEYVEADFGIAGDAAEAFGNLIERLESGEDYTDIPGLVHRQGDKIIVSEGRFASSFHNMPRMDLLDMRKYNGSGFGVGVVTKLAQAYYPRTDKANSFSGEDWRIRDVGEVIEEIRQLGDDFGINKIFFIDSGFNVPIEHAKCICKGVIDSGLKIRWNTYVRAGDWDAELARLMKQSGCSLALLAESGRSGEDLAERLDGLGNVATLCKEADLPFAMNITFGERGETEDSVEQKLNFLKEIEPAFAVLRVGSRILPNTELANRAKEDGLIESNADLLEPKFYISQEVEDWLVKRLRSESPAYPRWNLM